MRFTQLICELSHELFQEEAQLGVRLSPADLEPGEARELVASARERFSGEDSFDVFVAVSCPGEEALEEERACASPDERAAERATEWRNSIAQESKQRILYVSVERHGRAGGLEDTLYPIDDEALREAFVRWSERERGLFPQGLGAALREAGVASWATARALCAFGEAVAARAHEVLGLREEGSAGGDGDADAALWQLVGEQLPKINCAVDSNLNAEEAGERLKANARWVSQAAMGEARTARRSSAASKQAMSELEQALSLHSGSNEEALARIDLGALSTEALAPAKKQKRSSRKASASGSTSKSKTKGKQKNARASAKKQKRALSEAAEEGAASSSPASEAAAAAEPLPTAADLLPPTLTAPAGEAADGARGEAADEQPVEVTDEQREAARQAREDAARRRWARRVHKLEFGEPSLKLPPGLSALLSESLQGGGEGLEWRSFAAGPLAPVLGASARGLGTPTSRALPTAEALAQPLDAWRSARAAVASWLAADSERLPMLVGAPLIALMEPELMSGVEALIARASALHDAARELGDQDAARALLAAETICLRARDGEVLLVVSPLHPLWLGQVLWRARRLLEDATLSTIARRLVARALVQAHASPGTWPLDEASVLTPGPRVSGLMTFSTRPRLLTDAQAAAVTSRVTRRYLELHPHAHAALRVEVHGDEPAGVVEGVATTLSEVEALARAEVLYGGIASAIAGGDRSDAAVKAGALLLSALPTEQRLRDRRPPHLIIHLEPRAKPSPPPPDEEADADEAVAPLSVSFAAWSGALRVTSSLEGVAGVEAFARLRALAADEPSTGRFSQTLQVISPTEALQRGGHDHSAWVVGLGARFSSHVRGASLVLHEPIEETQAEVVITTSTKHLDAIARALGRVYAALGEQDQQPRQALTLTRKLAESSEAGIIDLTPRGERPIAAAVLAHALKSACPTPRKAIASVITAERYAALMGRPAQVDPEGAVILAADFLNEVLTLRVGYASLSANAPLQAEGSKARGLIGEGLERLVGLIELAGEDQGPGGDAAREALGWALWSALAAVGEARYGLAEALKRLGAGLKVDVALLALLHPDHPLTRHPEPLKVGKLPLQLESITSSRIQEIRPL